MGSVGWVGTTYATTLGYPAEVFEPDADLEAYLGIDSVRQTEVFARVLDRYGLAVPNGAVRVAGYPTLTAVADLVMGLTTRRAPAGTAA